MRKLVFENYRHILVSGVFNSGTRVLGFLQSPRSPRVSDSVPFVLRTQIEFHRVNFGRGGVIVERKLTEKNYCTEEVGGAPLWWNGS